MGNSWSRTITSLWPQFLAKEEVKLLLLGMDASGKTTLLYKLNSNKIPETSIPTIGINIETQKIRSTLFVSWDFSSRNPIRSLFRHFSKEAKGIIFMVDSNDMEVISVEQISREINYFTTDEKLDNVPFIIMCNKQDLPNAMAPEKVVEKLGLPKEGMSYKGHEWCAFPCVVTEGKGVDDALAWLFQTISRQKSMKKPESLVESIHKIKEEHSKNPIQHDFIDILGYDPTRASGNSTLIRFDPIKNGTSCPFAKAAKLWGGPGTSDQMTIEEQAEISAKPLLEFARQSESLKLDGYCVEIDDPSARGSSIIEFGQCVRRFLTALSDKDPKGEAVMKASYIGRNGWRFRFDGTDFFVTSFAPCYATSSSRYAFGTGRAFLLFQPEVSFFLHDLPIETPFEMSKKEQNNARTVREKTRLAFKHAGRPYHAPKHHGNTAGNEIVKPLVDNGKERMLWWVDPIKIIRF